MIRPEAEPSAAAGAAAAARPTSSSVFLPDRDSRVVRYGAVVALVFALALFVILLAAPESFRIGS